MGEECLTAAWREEDRDGVLLCWGVLWIFPFQGNNSTTSSDVQM